MADNDPSTPPVITVTGVSLTHKRLARRSRIDAVATPDEQTVPTGEHVAGRTSSTTPDGVGAWRLELVRAPGLVYAITDGTEVRLLVCDQTPGDHVAWSDLPLGVPPEQVETDPILGIASIEVVNPLLMRITLTDGRRFDVPTPRGPQGDKGDKGERGDKGEQGDAALSILPDPDINGLFIMSGTALAVDDDGLYPLISQIGA